MGVPDTQGKRRLGGQTAARKCNCKLLMPAGENKRRVGRTAIPPFAKLLWCLLLLLLLLQNFLSQAPGFYRNTRPRQPEPGWYYKASFYWRLTARHSTAQFTPTIKKVKGKFAQSASLSHSSVIVGSVLISILMALSRQWAADTAQSYGLYARVTSPIYCRRLGWHQIILLDDRGTCVCEQLAHGCYVAVVRPGVEPATSRSLVRHADH